MLLLFRALAEAFGNPPEGDEQRDEDQACHQERTPQRLPECGDRGAHRRVLGDDRHGEGGGLAVAQFEVHELGGIELP